MMMSFTAASIESLRPLAVVLAMGMDGTSTIEPDWQAVLWWLGGGLLSLWICLRLAPVSEALWEAATLLCRRPAVWLVPVAFALVGASTVWGAPLWHGGLAANLGLGVTRVLAFMHQPVIGAPAFVLGAALMAVNLFNSRVEASYHARSRLRWRLVQVYLLLLAPLYVVAALLLWGGVETFPWLPPTLWRIAGIVLVVGHAHGATLLLTALVVAAQDWRDRVRSSLIQPQLWLRAVREWPRLFPLAWIYAQLNLASQWLADGDLPGILLHGIVAPVFLSLLLALPVILAGCRVGFGHAGSLALEWWLRRPPACAWFIICGTLAVAFLQIGLGFLHAYVGGGNLFPWMLIQTGFGTLTGTWLVVGWVILIYDDGWLDEVAAPALSRAY